MNNHTFTNKKNRVQKKWGYEYNRDLEKGYFNFGFKKCDQSEFDCWHRFSYDLESNTWYFDSKKVNRKWNVKNKNLINKIYN